MKSKDLKTVVIVEGVLLVCLCLGLVIGGFYFFNSQATPTGGSQPPAPLATETTVAADPTLEPTAATPLETPTTGPSGTMLETLPDGSTKFTDYDGRYEVTFPAGWLVLRPGSQEFQEALNNASAKNPGLQDALQSTSDLDSNLDRAVAYDIKKGISPSGMAGYVIVRWDQADDVDVDAEIQLSVRRLEADPENQQRGIRIVATDTIVTANNLKVGRVGTKWNLTGSNGDLIPIYMPINFFRAQKGMVLLMLTTPMELRPQVEPDFSTIVDLAKLLGQ